MDDDSTKKDPRDIPARLACYGSAEEIRVWTKDHHGEQDTRPDLNRKWWIAVGLNGGRYIDDPEDRTNYLLHEWERLEGIRTRRRDIIVHPPALTVVDGTPDPATCPLCNSKSIVSSGTWFCSEASGPCRLG